MKLCAGTTSAASPDGIDRACRPDQQQFAGTFITVLRNELEACFFKGVANIRKHPVVGHLFFG
jgi:hypothetical protein